MTKSCKNCTKDFESRFVNSVYCSRSCSASRNNKIHPKRKPEGTCISCNKPTSTSRQHCYECWDYKLNKPRIRIDRPKDVVKYRQRAKLKAIEYKGGKCQKCDYSKSVRALHFHHTDPKSKDFTISGKSLSWENTKKELDKCILLCANCHAEEHDLLTTQ